MDHYPIPVISVKGHCEHVITMQYMFQKLAGIPFEAYGVENYLEDFYLMGMTIDEMHESIKQSDEDEIGFNFNRFCIGKKQIFKK